MLIILEIYSICRFCVQEIKEHVIRVGGPAGDSDSGTYKEMPPTDAIVYLSDV